MPGDPKAHRGWGLHHQPLQTRHGSEDEVKRFLLLLSCTWGPARKARAVPPLLPSPPSWLSQQLEPAPRRHLVRIKPAPSTFSVIICVAKLPSLFFFSPPSFHFAKTPTLSLGPPSCPPSPARAPTAPGCSDDLRVICHRRALPYVPGSSGGVRLSVRLPGPGSPPSGSRGVWGCRDASAAPSWRTQPCAALPPPATLQDAAPGFGAWPSLSPRGPIFLRKRGGSGARAELRSRRAAVPAPLDVAGVGRSGVCPPVWGYLG